MYFTILHTLHKLVRPVFYTIATESGAHYQYEFSPKASKLD